MNTNNNHVLSVRSINSNILKAEYAVRGELALKAEELAKTLKSDPKSLPFEKITFCNIGNPQQLGQVPISFFRQVLALVQCPDILLDPSKQDALRQLYPGDAIQRAKEICENVTSLGAYSHSKGIPFIRKNVAEFIERRDGYPSDPECIFLTDGASDGIKRILNLLIRDDNDGIMISIPQYPLYSAAINLFGGKIVPYYLDEDHDWDLNVKELDRAFAEAQSKGIRVRALCVINPGNPTGNHLSEHSLIDIVKFCKQKRIVLLADEVYQTNILSGRPFVSFKKVVKDLGSEFKHFELFSFHSTSKGFLGECGKRGGYLECHGIDHLVMEEIYKVASIGLCPNVDGQIMVDLMVKPPKEGDESFEGYSAEIKAIKESLERRARLLTQRLNQLEGVTCNAPQGALYIFPKINFPSKFLKEALRVNRSPDDLYAIQLLENTGICVVPGTGFGQVLGTFHFRLTFLPCEHEFPSFLSQLEHFHQMFMQTWN